jgi:transcription elongation factor GreB
VVVRPEELGGDVIRFGAVVEVVDEEGQRKTYSLVGPDEADPARGKLSFQSPMGQALMKRRVGDVVVVKRPAGELELEIVSLRYGV